MRRIVVLAVLLAACNHYGWTGTQELSRPVSAPADTMLYAAARALRAHGYEARIVNGQMVMTLPKAAPQYTRPVSTNPELDGDQWVIQVQTEPNSFRTGSTLKVSAFLLPKASQTPGDSVRQRNAIPVDSSRPELLREVERVGNWIVEEAAKKP